MIWNSQTRKVPFETMYVKHLSTNQMTVKCIKFKYMIFMHLIEIKTLGNVVKGALQPISTNTMSPSPQKDQCRKFQIPTENPSPFAGFEVSIWLKFYVDSYYTHHKINCILADIRQQSIQSFNLTALEPLELSPRNQIWHMICKWLPKLRSCLLTCLSWVRFSNFGGSPYCPVQHCS